MDPRRLDTGQVLAGGILDIQVPRTDIPENRDHYDPRDRTDLTPAAALDLLKLLYVPEYYGVVAAWKDDAGYHGRLLQYRAVTEAPDFATAADCAAWFTRTVESVTG